MRIRGWHIDGFGIHHDQQVTDLPAGLTVITGPNESGKTTLQHFLAGVLFGYPNKGRADRHEPVNGGNYGGRLFVTDESGRDIVIHRGAAKRSLRLAMADGDLDSSELANLIGGASKDLFHSVFAVHLADLGELKALTADQVRERVFSAGIVGAGRTAEAALTELSGARDMLLRPSGRGAYLLKSVQEDLAAARRQLADARRDAAQLPDLLQQIQQLEYQAGSLRRRGLLLAGDLDVLRAVQAVWPAWVNATDAQAQLASLGPVPNWDSQAVASLRSAVALRTERSAALAAANQQLRSAEQAAASLPVPGPAGPLSARIDQVAQQAHGEQQRQEQTAALRRRLAASLADVDATLARLGPHQDLTWLAEHAPSAEAAANVVRLAAATEDARRQAAAAVAEQHQVKADLDEEASHLRHAADVASAAPGPSAQSAAQYLDATTRLIALLGQRDAAKRHLAAAADQAAAAGRRPAHRPNYQALWAGGLIGIVAGVALVAAGITTLGAALTAAGLALALSGAIAHRRQNASSHSGTAPAPDALTAHVTTELAQIDAELAPILSTLHLDQRPTASVAAEMGVHAHRIAAEAHNREAAKRQTTDLVDAHQRTTQRRLRATADEVARSAAILAEADRRWTDRLSNHLLPPSLDPAETATFLATVEQARAAARSVALVTEDLAHVEAASNTFSLQVIDLAEELGLDVAADRLETVEQLLSQSRLSSKRAIAMDSAAALISHRQIDRDQAIAALDAADADLKTRLGEAAVADADNALEQIERVEHARTLRATVDLAETRLAASLRAANQLDHARALLADPQADPELWAAQSTQLVNELEADQNQRDAIVRQCSTVQGHVDALSASADIPSLELHVSDLETQLVDSVTQWASFHLAHKMVEGTLTRYQRERQPEVVQRAAELFRHVTDGHYTRLEVRGTEVIAINRAGQEVPAIQLSQGTTEQLYLCMRFALADSFSKTAALPILLDDITVNADPDRLARLATLVATISETHQVFVFSCQEHLVELLRKADPEARIITLAPTATPTAQIGAVS